MKKLTKIISLLLAVVLLTGTFAGCNKNKGEDTGEEFVYVANYVDFPFDANYVNNSVTIGDKIYFSYEAVVDTIIHTESNVDYYIDDSLKYNPDVETAPAIGEEVPEPEVNEVVDEALAAEDILIEAPMEPADPEDQFTWEEEVYATVISGMNIDGTDPVEFEVGLEPNDYDNGIYRSVYGLYDVGNGNIGILINENTDIYDVPEDFDETVESKWDYYSGSESKYTLKIFDKDGKFVEERVVYQSDSNSEFSPWNFAFDENGNSYLSNYEKIVICDKNGNTVKTIEGAKSDSIGRVSGGKMGFLGWEENAMKLRIIDDKTFEVGESVEIPNDCYEIKSYSDDYILIYNGFTSLFGIKENGEKEKILGWLDVDISPESVSSFSVLKNGDVFCFCHYWDSTKGENSIDVIHFVKTPAKDIKQKTVITLAANYLDWETRSLVLEFNKTNPDYRIKVTDYSEYQTNDDRNAGLTKLNTEIMAGKVPDIICSDGISIRRYAGKGLLEDLTPYIEKSIGINGLVEPFANVLKNDEGKIYEIYSALSFQTHMGLKKVVGEGYSWTFNDLKEAIAKLPEGASVFEDYYTKSTVLSDFVNRNIDSFVDWEKGTCDFESQEFSDLLAFANTFPLEIDWGNYDYEEHGDTNDNIRNGKQLLKGVYMYDFDGWRENFYIFGDGISFIGLPTVSGSGSSFMSVGGGFAMSATSQYKDVVWDFIGQILTEEYQTRDSDPENGYFYSNGFPTNKAAFDLMANYAMTPTFDEFYDPSENQGGMRVFNSGNYGYIVDDKINPFEEGVTYAEDVDGNVIINDEGEAVPVEKSIYREGLVNEKGWHEVPKSWAWLENGSIPVYSMSQEEYDILMEMFNSCDSIYRYDTDIATIIDEETQGYFQGQKTLEDTVKMIQSRVKLYVNEQK